MPFEQRATFDPRIVVDSARTIAQQIDEYRNRRDSLEAQLANADTVINTARALGPQSGGITPDEFERIRVAAPRERIGVAGGLIMRQTDFYKQQQLKAQLAESDARLWDSNNAGRPQPLIAPDGTVIQGYYIPGARQIIGRDQPSVIHGGPPPSLTIPPGWVWNGRQLVQAQPENASEVDQLLRLQQTQQAQQRSAELRQMDEEIASLQGEVASGNKRPGPDFLPFATSYADSLAGARAKRNALAQSTGPAIASIAQPAPTPAPAPASQEDLRALARQALNDPTATPEHKAAARRILGL